MESAGEWVEMPNVILAEANATSSHMWNIVSSLQTRVIMLECLWNPGNEKVVIGGKGKKDLQEGLWNTGTIKGKEGGLSGEREGA